MSASPYGRGVMGLLKKGWHEIPGVMGSSIYGLVGLGMFAYVTYVYQTRGIPPRRFLNDYIVVRPDDPRANKPTIKYPL